MDKTTTIEELTNVVKDFCEKRNWGQFHNPKDLAIGISTEANELLQIFRFKSDEDLTQIMLSSKKELIEDEVADILYFLLRFAQMNNINLSNALYKKIAKNEKKYPLEKAKNSNKKYNE